MIDASSMSVESPEGPSPLDPRVAQCPAREIPDLLGDKWSALIVVLLGEKTHRFNELHRAVDDISQRMLTRTLRGLERDGLVERTVFPTVPLRVDYDLTDLGRTLLVPLEALRTWASDHRTDIQVARREHDERSPKS